ncbi:hypothetical protein [Leisingera aquimarina]|nr:hypothetical protein [Leisingera aquimarina]
MAKQGKPLLRCSISWRKKIANAAAMLLFFMPFSCMFALGLSSRGETASN